MKKQNKKIRKLKTKMTTTKKSAEKAAPKKRMEPADKPATKVKTTRANAAVSAAINKALAAGSPPVTEIPPSAPEVVQEPPLGNPKGITLVGGAAPKEKPANKRITPGAEVKEWRIARSLRHGMHGFFLQGGYVEEKAGRKMFRVGEEKFFKSLNDAKKALVAKLPEAVEVGEASPVEQPVTVH